MASETVVSARSLATSLASEEPPWRLSLDETESSERPCEYPLCPRERPLFENETHSLAVNHVI
jgi:hypothetical protein